MNKLKLIMTSYLSVQARALGFMYPRLDSSYFVNINRIQHDYNVLIYAFYRTMKNNNEEENFSELKESLIQKMNFKTPDDAIPFYQISIQSLLMIIKCINKDVESGFCTSNRLYYISDRIKCPPSVVSRYIAKRTFLYTLSSNWLENSLNVILEMKVPKERILRDLWVLKYHHSTIKNRLQRVKDKGVDNLYPWMVRCSEDILNRSIQISQETKSILGEGTTTQMYLANRLKISSEAVEQFCMKVPGLKTIRVTKVKNFLDFLTSEGYDVQEIANTIRILTTSQKTVKHRLEKLKRIGIHPVNLNILCKNRKDFKKYYDAICNQSSLQIKTEN